MSLTFGHPTLSVWDIDYSCFDRAEYNIYVVFSLNIDRAAVMLWQIEIIRLSNYIFIKICI